MNTFGWLDNILTDTLPDDAGTRLGRQVGCQIASNFERNLPPFPVFAGNIDYGKCPLPGERRSAIENMVSLPTAKLMGQVQEEAGRIAEARIKARLMPYFIGLPIAFFAIGLGVGYLKFRK